jgi:hypothetical protein
MLREVRGGFGGAEEAGGVRLRETTVGFVGEIREGIPCSSISVRCPGLVRSATVLLKRVMNSP